MAQLYARVFLKVLESSIAEDFTLRHVFEDFLKLAEDGVVDMTRESLARRLNIPLETLNLYITRLESPDPKSRNPAHEGRRIARLEEHRDWGWVIVNWEEYERIRFREDERERVRMATRKWRQNKGKTSDPPPTPPPKPDPTPDSDSEQQSLSVTGDKVSSPTVTNSASHSEQDGNNGKFALEAEEDDDGKQNGMRNHPTPEQCEFYAAKIGLPVSQAAAFHDFYESNGWRVGKNPMRSWRGAMRSWRVKWEERRSQPSGLPTMNIKRGVDTLEDQLERERKIWEKL